MLRQTCELVCAYHAPDTVLEECYAGRARGSRGIERVSKPRGLAARVVQVEGGTAEASLSIERAGVLALTGLFGAVIGVLLVWARRSSQS